jgi:hypothetical protein
MAAQEDRADPLIMLGQVSPPDPAVLERARDMLWSVVAAQMLDLSPEDGGWRKPGNAEHDRHREA